jgi:hypothetical protein
MKRSKQTDDEKDSQAGLLAQIGNVFHQEEVFQKLQELIHLICTPEIHLILFLP